MVVGPLLQQEKDPDRPFADEKRRGDTQMRVKSVLHFASAPRLSFFECLRVVIRQPATSAGLPARGVRPAQPLKFIGACRIPESIRLPTQFNQQAPGSYSTAVGKTAMRKTGVPHR